MLTYSQQYCHCIDSDINSSKLNICIYKNHVRNITLYALATPKTAETVRNRRFFICDNEKGNTSKSNISRVYILSRKKKKISPMIMLFLLLCIDKCNMYSFHIEMLSNKKHYFCLTTEYVINYETDYIKLFTFCMFDDSNNNACRYLVYNFRRKTIYNLIQVFNLIVAIT